MPRRRDPDLSRALGLRLRSLRLAHGLTQERLAEIVDIQPSSVSRFEGGRGGLGLMQLAGLAQALGIELPELVAVGAEVPSPPRATADDWGQLWLQLRDDQRDLAYRAVRDLLRALR